MKLFVRLAISFSFTLTQLFIGDKSDIIVKIWESRKVKISEKVAYMQKNRIHGGGGIRTHASEETGALNQRLRPLTWPRYLSEVSPSFV